MRLGDPPRGDPDPYVTHRQPVSTAVPHVEPSVPAGITGRGRTQFPVRGTWASRGPRPAERQTYEWNRESSRLIFPASSHRPLADGARRPTCPEPRSSLFIGSAYPADGGRGRDTKQIAQATVGSGALWEGILASHRAHAYGGRDAGCRPIELMQPMFARREFVYQSRGGAGNADGPTVQSRGVCRTMLEC